MTEILAKELEMDQAEVRKRVEKVSSMEKVKTNVEKEVGDKIREYNLDGVKVDEDYKRYYPYDSLASKVLGFTGGDNQGIIGLEVKYEETLKGSNGTILTTTDARGIELDAVAEGRIEPVAGKTLEISMDYNIQKYCEQAAEKVMREKQADGVSILLMNPQNGEILSMVNVPEFNLNDPFELNTGEELEGEKLQDALNAMWRNRCINDTYEPGSTFKIITSAACLEEGVVTPEENIGLVELATISFGQSFQVTPVQMAVTVSSIINGGRRVTPHFGKAVLDREGNVLETLSYEERSGVVSEKTSKTMQTLLEGVVANGSGKNAYIEGYSIGGKTATSQTLPRSANKYISSFIGFAPAEDPQVLGMVVIHNPQGIYYGGTIAAPVLRSIFDNVLPYLGIEKQ